MVVTAIDGVGTPESTWLPSLAARHVPQLDLVSLQGRAVVVVAAHPDDEVLAVGALLRRLHETSPRVDIVWATDGEASHVGTNPLIPLLGSLRPEESDRALTMLGVTASSTHRLGLPDGGIATHEATLSERIAAVATNGCVLIAPWSGDGHPDHEACGRAARRACPDDALVLEYPIWAWHWATPDSGDIPWHRVVQIPLRLVDRAAKLAAIGAFATQVLPLGPGPDDGPVLTSATVMRFVRDFEVVLMPENRERPAGIV